MNIVIDTALLALIVSSMLLLGFSQIRSCIRAVAIQGFVLGALPLVAHRRHLLVQVHLGGQRGKRHRAARFFVGGLVQRAQAVRFHVTRGERHTGRQRRERQLDQPVGFLQGQAQVLRQRVRPRPSHRSADQFFRRGDP